jgi:glutamine synthetase
MIAAGLHGIDNELALEPAYPGNAYNAEGKQRLPGSLHESIALLEGSAIARAAFGDDVVDHYLHYARTEQRSFEAAVTDWERFRSFERM